MCSLWCELQRTWNTFILQKRPVQLPRASRSTYVGSVRSCTCTGNCSPLSSGPSTLSFPLFTAGQCGGGGAHGHCPLRRWRLNSFLYLNCLPHRSQLYLHTLRCLARTWSFRANLELNIILHIWQIAGVCLVSCSLP